MQADLGLVIDERLTLKQHHKQTAAKLLAATHCCKRVVGKASYSVLKLVWSSFLMPIALNASLLASATATQDVVQEYNKSYRIMFSRKKPEVSPKIEKNLATFFLNGAFV